MLTVSQVGNLIQKHADTVKEKDSDFNTKCSKCTPSSHFSILSIIVCIYIILPNYKGTKY